MKKLFIAIIVTIVSLVSSSASAQKITLEDLKDLDITSIIGKGSLLKVKKGFSPKFSIGNNQINTVGILGEKLKGINILGDILGKKGSVGNILGYYKTYKTGLVIFKILGAAGTVATVIGTVKGFASEQKFSDNDVKKLLYPAVGSIATGVLTKLLTKAASYKAVDIFNGIARKKLKDILSIEPASSTMGVGLYVKL